MRRSKSVENSNFAERLARADAMRGRTFSFHGCPEGPPRTKEAKGGDDVEVPPRRPSSNAGASPQGPGRGVQKLFSGIGSKLEPPRGPNASPSSDNLSTRSTCAPSSASFGSPVSQRSFGSPASSQRSFGSPFSQRSFRVLPSTSEKHPGPRTRSRSEPATDRCARDEPLHDYSREQRFGAQAIDKERQHDRRMQDFDRNLYDHTVKRFVRGGPLGLDRRHGRSAPAPPVPSYTALTDRGMRLREGEAARHTLRLRRHVRFLEAEGDSDSDCAEEFEGTTEYTDSCINGRWGPQDRHAAGLRSVEFGRRRRAAYRPEMEESKPPPPADPLWEPSPEPMSLATSTEYGDFCIYGRGRPEDSPAAGVRSVDFCRSRPRRSARSLPPPAAREEAATRRAAEGWWERPRAPYRPSSAEREEEAATRRAVEEWLDGPRSRHRTEVEQREPSSLEATKRRPVDSYRDQPRTRHRSDVEQREPRKVEEGTKRRSVDLRREKPRAHGSPELEQREPHPVRCQEGVARRSGDLCREQPPGRCRPELEHREPPAVKREEAAKRRSLDASRRDPPRPRGPPEVEGQREEPLPAERLLDAMREYFGHRKGTKFLDRRSSACVAGEPADGARQASERPEAATTMAAPSPAPPAAAATVPAATVPAATALAATALAATVPAATALAATALAARPAVGLPRVARTSEEEALLARQREILARLAQLDQKAAMAGSSRPSEPPLPPPHGPPTGAAKKESALSRGFLPENAVRASHVNQDIFRFDPQVREDVRRGRSCPPVLHAEQLHRPASHDDPDRYGSFFETSDDSGGSDDDRSFCEHDFGYDDGSSSTLNARNVPSWLREADASDHDAVVRSWRLREDTAFRHLCVHSTWLGEQGRAEREVARAAGQTSAGVARSLAWN